MNLIDTIDEYLNKNNDDYYPNDSDWVLFVKDHKAIILEESSTLNVDASTVDINRYSVESFLKENGLPISIAWIVIWINQLDSAMNFDYTLDELVIPAHTTIRKLKKAYIDVRTYRKKTVINSSS